MNLQIKQFPKLLELVRSKNIKLYLGPCKVVKTLKGVYCLVSPVFGSGYYGSFKGDTFYPTRECKQEFIDLLQRVEDNGLAAVNEIGLLTGHCCVCGRELVAEGSIASGIGPICAGKVGFESVSSTPNFSEEF